ncbi:hypothetical protein FHX10_003388 [Rhizobium sp. BK591]|uniref:hypothetical protein n=1 Tax=Rhizobium sp. BK591 TaxID=2586985 RepID=UPI00161D472C|nr:hypothetical protein [Rhizobium sp. BK591]MBB3743889.1 hypothetical protein [Rhizobium sp. BK591]
MNIWMMEAGRCEPRLLYGVMPAIFPREPSRALARSVRTNRQGVTVDINLAIAAFAATASFLFMVWGVGRNY